MAFCTGYRGLYHLILLPVIDASYYSGWNCVCHLVRGVIWSGKEMLPNRSAIRPFHLPLRRGFKEAMSKQTPAV
jgi:hypothetical protein